MSEWYLIKDKQPKEHEIFIGGYFDSKNDFISSYYFLGYEDSDSGWLLSEVDSKDVMPIMSEENNYLDGITDDFSFITHWRELPLPPEKD